MRIVAGERHRVYPRPRGVTLLNPHGKHAYGGLSPPTRGNQYAPRFRIVAGRSIPAHAG